MPVKKTYSVMTSQTTAKLWGELSDLCQKARYWLYTRQDKAKAAPYADRLQDVLSELPANDLAIVRAEALALISELRGKTKEAIAHRQREIELMMRLQADAKSPSYDESTRTHLLRGRGEADLQKRRSILVALQNGTVAVG